MSEWRGLLGSLFNDAECSNPTRPADLDSVEVAFNPRLPMSFDCLLFIGEEGNGDLYRYRVLVGLIESPDIYRWDHENDSRIWFARDLEDYVRRLADPEAV